MDYEKKYKEALKKAEEIIKYYKERNRDEASIEDLGTIFPELKESEDERIKGAIIDYLKDSNLTEWAAWLEKQVEQKPVVFKAKDWYVSKVDGKIHNMMYNPADKKELKKIDNEIEIPFGAKDSELQEVTYFIPEGFHAEIDADKVVIKKGEKPVEWSADDEVGWTNTMIMIKESASNHYTKDSIKLVIDWLKSLKERMKGV